MKNQPELNVVIVNFNSGQALEQCINHLLEAPGIDIDITVIDNASSDHSCSFIMHCVPPIRFIKNNANVGFAVACNQGAKLGKAPQIAFINPDCFINRQQVSQLHNQLVEVESAGLIGCRVLNEDGSLQAASRRRLPTFWRIVWHLTGLSQFSLFKGINIKDSGQFDSVQNVEAVNGACVLVKRTAFEQLKGFDEAFPLHFEDLDLFARLKAENYTILYDSSVEVKHLKGHSTQDKQKIKLWKRQGLLLYLAKHRPYWEYRVAKFWLGAREL